MFSGEDNVGQNSKSVKNPETLLSLINDENSTAESKNNHDKAAMMVVDHLESTIELDTTNANTKVASVKDSEVDEDDYEL